MSRSRKDGRGGHPWPGYFKECSGVKKMWRRKQRRENSKAEQTFGEYEPSPQRSTGGWITW